VLVPRSLLGGTYFPNNTTAISSGSWH